MGIPVKRAVLGDHGRIVIPAEFRQELGYHKGDKLIFRVENGELRVFDAKAALKSAQALMQKYAPNADPVEDLLRARRMDD